MAQSVTEADQWLLAAAVKLTALNNAQPDGPKATAFLSRSCDTLVAEIEEFRREKLEPIIFMAGSHTSAVKTDKKPSSTARLLLQQAEDMKSEADCLIQVVQPLKVCAFMATIEMLCMKTL